MEYKVNYNGRFKRNVISSNLSVEYKKFLIFIDDKILKEIQPSLLLKGRYEEVAYWSSFLYYFKNSVTNQEKEYIFSKWSKAFANGYDLKTKISHYLSNNIDFRNKEAGNTENEKRENTVRNFIDLFVNYIKNLNIPELKVVIPKFIETNVLNIMKKYSPKWNNKNAKDVLPIINDYKKEFEQIKELWLTHVSNKDAIYQLGLEIFIKNYIKRNVLNKISIPFNNLINNFQQKTWSFKDNLNSYQVDNLDKVSNIYNIFHLLKENFQSILEENLKMQNLSHVNFSLVTFSKSSVRESFAGFKEIDVFFEGTIKLILDPDKEIIKNWKIKVPNVLFYNPNEEFNILINDLIKEINDKKIFKISKLNLLEDQINNLDNLSNWFNTNGFYSPKLLKLDAFKNLFSSYELRDFKIEFINVGKEENNKVFIIERPIKLKFEFYDSIKLLNEKIVSNKIQINSSKLLTFKKIQSFLKRNIPKYIFLYEWDISDKPKNSPKKLFPKNDEWSNIVEEMGFKDDNEKDLPWPKFWYASGTDRSLEITLFIRISNQINWKYSSSSNIHLGWQPPEEKLKESWSMVLDLPITANSQKDYMRNWIKNKLKIRNDFIKNDLKKIKSKDNIDYENIFENLNELNIEANNLDILYTPFFEISNDSESYYVLFEFKNLKGEKLYTIKKPLFKRATIEEINKIKNEINNIHKKNLDQLSKTKLSNEKEFSEKFLNLYNKTQTNYFQNDDFLKSDVNEIKLKKILEDYREETKKIWIEILRLKHLEKNKEIENLKGASDEEKKELLKQLDEKLIESLSQIHDLNLDYESISNMLDSIDWNFKSVLTTKAIISKTFKYILASSGVILGIGAAASGATLFSLVKSKKKFKKNNLEFKSKKGLIFLTSLIGIGSIIGSVGLSLFVFVTQGGF